MSSQLGTKNHGELSVNNGCNYVAFNLIGFEQLIAWVASRLKINKNKRKNTKPIFQFKVFVEHTRPIFLDSLSLWLSTFLGASDENTASCGITYEKSKKIYKNPEFRNFVSLFKIHFSGYQRTIPR